MKYSDIVESLKTMFLSEKQMLSHLAQNQKAKPPLPLTNLTRSSRSFLAQPSLAEANYNRPGGLLLLVCIEPSTIVLPGTYHLYLLLITPPFILKCVPVWGEKIRWASYPQFIYSQLPVSPGASQWENVRSDTTVSQGHMPRKKYLFILFSPSILTSLFGSQTCVRSSVNTNMELFLSSDWLLMAYYLYLTLYGIVFLCQINLVVHMR